MARRASKWIIHEAKNDRWDLSRGGRYYYTGLSSQAEAVRRLKNHHRPGEPVILEERDGYRTNITNQLKAKGIL